ncbi:DUF6034 family protein [Muricomes intestini]|uniref:DUF6034 family protein n=1 Tax=Muricomes intestini TaxID=1796634 RepID=UPI002FDEE875
MKKRIGMVVFILIFGISLAACVNTPDEKAVVDKSEGLTEEIIIPKEDKIPKELGVPEHWQETIDKGEGFVNLSADCDIRIPDVYNTPVYSYERQSMTNKLLKKLCTYFSKGDKFYEDPAMTRSELNSQKDKMVNYKGNWGRYGGALDRKNVQEMTARMDELIEKAPESTPEHKYIDARLMAPHQTEVEYVKGWWYTRIWHEWYYDTEEKIGFTARIDKGREIDPIIRAINYDDRVGSTTGFVFSQGTFIDEKELERDYMLQKAFEYRNEEYLNYLNDKMEQTVDKTFSEEDALKEVDQILEDLTIEGLAVTDCVKAIGTMNSESWAGLDEDNLPMDVGYSIYLSPKAGDLLGYPFPRIYLYNDLPETLYAPSFLTERLRIIVTKEGIQRFEWIDISKKKDTIAENTKLLSFDQIKDRLVEHLFYANLSTLEETEGYHILYEVKSIQLRAANINAYEDPSAAWLVPVWVFDLERSLSYQTTDQSLEDLTGIDTVVLNAIDGGYVTLQFD